jgi:hypothetical protein
MGSGAQTAGQPWWRPRWYELVPEAVLVLGLTFFLVDQTDAATSAFRSGRAVALMAAVALAWVGLRVVLARTLPFPAARAVIFAVGAAAVLAVVVIPAYDDDTVVETFPVASGSMAVTTLPGPEITAPPGPATTTVPAVPPTAARTAAPPATTPLTAPPTTVAPVTTVPAPQPDRLRTGSFRGVDHRASGTVSIYRQPDGRYVVGLEDFDIQPGPDYDVYVVPGTDKTDRDGGTRLDDLRGNRGTQYYEVPAGVDLGEGAWSVLVWCQTFAVPVATATPA